MYFLIDYENVNYAGLEGTEFLMQSDTVCFFYSEKSSKIVRYRMLNIEESGCDLEICKLQNTRKNALDFYIASKVGEIFATNPHAKIAIISVDKDYQSVLDYWKPRLASPDQLVRTKTIAKAISFVNDETGRKGKVIQKMRTVDLQMEYARLEERKRIANVLEELFSETEYKEMLPKIVDMVTEDSRPKVLYLNLLKIFGRASGIEVYHKLKECAESLS